MCERIKEGARTLGRKADKDRHRNTEKRDRETAERGREGGRERERDKGPMRTVTALEGNDEV